LFAGRLKEESSLKISRGSFFWHLKRVFSAQDGCREKLKTIFKIP
jgi:hypothetical protein